MKLLILFLCVSCATAHRQELRSYTTGVNVASSTMIALLDSIDLYPELYATTLYHPDTSLHGPLKSFAHRFEGYTREGRDSIGRQRLTLYNRLYDCKYSYVVNNHWKGENFDPQIIDTSKVTRILILKDRSGAWISHWGCEFIVIITTK